MNAFQILDADKNPIEISQLDKEAADFWGKQVDKKYYTHPQKKLVINNQNLRVYRQLYIL